MRSAFSFAPGVVWSAVIVGLMLLADWLQTYFGGVAWVVPLAAFISTVVVPVLKVLVVGEEPAGRYVGERNLINRLLW